MAKNISLLGADYQNVPAVQLPQTGGGVATFYDIDKLVSVEDTATVSFEVGSKYWCAILIGMITGVSPVAVLMYGKGSQGPQLVDLSGGALADGKNALTVTQPTNTSVTVTASAKFRECTVYLA